MKIKVPEIKEQLEYAFKAESYSTIKKVQDGLNAPEVPDDVEQVDDINVAHLLTKQEGWKAPDKDVVGAYFRHFQRHFPEYGSDAKLAALLGLGDGRRIRGYKKGTEKTPYGVWRRFLVLTGRVPQDAIDVICRVRSIH